LAVAGYTSVVSCQSRQSNEVGNGGFFSRATDRWLSDVKSTQRNYGVAVSDVDNDGDFEMIVAGYSGPNLVLKYDPSTGGLRNIAEPGTPYESLMDTPGNAIGVAACDLDGDGREEIYFLNTNQAYGGRAAYGDKMFKFRNGRYEDLYGDPVNAGLTAKEFAGRSVACLDRNGDGKYGFIIATYSSGGEGRFALVEMDESIGGGRSEIKLRNVASEAGIDKATGGRGIAVGPILQDDGKLDVFFDNEGNSRRGNSGANFLFKNKGDGSFQDVAAETGVEDGYENGRGITLADFNGDGLIDVTYGNWAGEHRMYIQKKGPNGNRYFEDVATTDYSDPTLIRTVIAADLDNDGHLEVFHNNIDSYGQGQPNKVFRVESQGMDRDPQITQLPIGDALETKGHGTGGAVADLDKDGVLDLLLAHGESTASQALELYKVNNAKNNDWLRVLPLTRQGAPARGATVYLSPSGVLGADDLIKTVVIDSGSGYLCQMEPVAHFGLGRPGSQANDMTLSVRWPDGSNFSKSITSADLRQTHVIPYPK